jgi:ABC-type branched-subunit amino acid transport system ATPase component
VIVPPTLQAKNVTVRLGERALLNDVTPTLPSGSMTVLLGPNGAGKTTLIRVLAGILPATAGDVFLGSLRLHALGRSATAQHCAYLPQQTGTSFEMRVEDVVTLGRYPHIGLCAFHGPKAQRFRSTGVPKAPLRQPKGTRPGPLLSPGRLTRYASPSPLTTGDGNEFYRPPSTNQN